MCDIHWILLHDSTSGRNVAGVFYDPDLEIIRCMSSRASLVKALDGADARFDDITSLKTGSLTAFTTVRITDPEHILNRAVTPYLKPLQIGARGKMTGTMNENS